MAEPSLSLFLVTPPPYLEAINLPFFEVTAATFPVVSCGCNVFKLQLLLLLCLLVLVSNTDLYFRSAAWPPLLALIFRLMSSK